MSSIVPLERKLKESLIIIIFFLNAYNQKRETKRERERKDRRRRRRRRERKTRLLKSSLYLSLSCSSLSLISFYSIVTRVTNMHLMWLTKKTKPASWLILNAISSLSCPSIPEFAMDFSNRTTLSLSLSDSSTCLRDSCRISFSAWTAVSRLSPDASGFFGCWGLFLKDLFGAVKGSGFYRIPSGFTGISSWSSFGILGMLDLGRIRRS